MKISMFTGSLALAVALLSVPAGLAAPLVANEREPVDGTRSAVLHELWRIGGEDGEHVFGLISDVIVGPEGNYYILDAQLNEVTIVSPSGEILRVIGREGDGPGEFRTALALVPTSAASIGVAQTFPARLVGLNTDGTPHAGIEIPAREEFGSVMLNDLVYGGDGLVVQGMDMGYSADRTKIVMDPFVSRFEIEGLERRDYFRSSFEIEPGRKLREEELAKLDTPFAVDATGRVVVAPERNRYRLEVYGRDGDLEFAFEKDHQSWQRSERAKFFALHLARSFSRSFAVYDIDLADTEPDIVDIVWRPDGTFWVQTGQAVFWHPKGEFLFDVFTAAGEFDHRLRLPLDADPALDHLVFAGSDRALLVRGFMDAALGMADVKRTWVDPGDVAPMELVVYEITS